MQRFAIGTLIGALLIGLGLALTMGSGDPAAAFEPNELTVPDGTPEELLQFIQKVKEAPNDATTREEQLAEAKRRYTAIVEAAGKILAADPDDDIRKQATIEKLQGLSVLGQIGEPDAFDKLEAFASKVADSKDEDLREAGQVFNFAAQMYKIQGAEKVEQKQLKSFLESAQAYVNSGQPDAQRAQVAMATGQTLEHAGAYDLAKVAYRDFSAYFKKSANPAFRRYSDAMEGSLERLSLLGNELSLTGETLRGDKEFDWSKYRGKVVLVDFWATWCGPCLREFPNIKAAYEKYHDKGFEIVGVSLDDAGDKEAVQKFVQEEGLEWTHLFSDDPEASGWENPLAQKYHISAIPAMMLVDQEGKVVTFQARGEALGEQLERLLGSGE